MAVRKWKNETNRGFVEPELMRIMSITSGTGRGKLHILYRNGKWEERILTGQRMFQGIVRFPDGKEETLFMLQGCGNDVRFSGNRNMPMGDFVFTPDSEPVPVTQVGATPSVTPATGVVTAPPVAAPATTEKVVSDDTVYIEIKGVDGDKPAMVRLFGVDTTADNSVELTRGVITVRFTRK